MHQIRPKHLVSEIVDNMRAGLNTMIWGGPGIGKSEIPEQILMHRLCGIASVCAGLGKKLHEFICADDNLFNMARNSARGMCPARFSG